MSLANICLRPSVGVSFDSEHTVMVAGSVIDEKMLAYQKRENVVDTASPPLSTRLSDS